MTSATFAETPDRVRAVRSLPAWSLRRLLLAPLPASSLYPGFPNLGPADALEAQLLRLPEESWQSYDQQQGPIPDEDAWERALFEDE